MVKMEKLQNGIYYRRHQLNDLALNNGNSRNNCFAIAFLRISNSITSFQTADYIGGLWKMYLNLKKGVVSDLPGRRVPSGRLSVLLGYGPNIFVIPGTSKKTPRDLRGKQFREAVSGKPILEGSGINYSFDVPRNLGITDHIVVQFVSDSQLATYRAVVETRKYIALNVPPRRGISLSTFFTGFQRDDCRSWLGFHDEISNMNTRERRKAIVIDRTNNDLVHQDFWTAGGTYLAFLRIEINLPIWEQIKRSDQEILIGRDKLDGIPLVGIDKNGNPIKIPGCRPFSEVRSFDKRFHDHPNYFKRPSAGINMRTKIDTNSSIRFLSQSHIGRTRHIDHIKSLDPASRRIFRQGFDFIEPSYDDSTEPLRVGLNFISFQNDPTRLLFILTDPNWLGNSNFAGTGDIPGMKDFLSVKACGIFFVPPNELPFPGASIFR
jgi:deferrochelatase/peroxidase EfeB